MRNYLKKWLRPTRSELYSALILVWITVLNFFAPQFYSKFFPDKISIDFAPFQSEILTFLENNNPKKPIASIHTTQRNTFKNPVLVSLFEFNPNKASKEDFINLGLSKKVSQTILNYRNKGGKFRTQEDLKKVYGLRTEDYERLKPFMIFEQAPKSKVVEVEDTLIIAKTATRKIAVQKIKPAPDKTTLDIKIDVNKASIEEWKKLRGIGDYFSKKIVKFRDALGGFASIDQISETYNLPDSTFKSIEPHLVLSPIIKKINVNTASAEELKSHPYLTWKQANGIVKYRKKHGAFVDYEALKRVGGALKEEVLERIKPYLSFE
jgi:competence ComEA-like helix-hairpin-helix protein